MNKISTFEEDVQDITEPKTTERQNIQYGNLIMFSKRIHISLGPDYKFTIAAFTFLSLISFTLYKFGQRNLFGAISQILNLLISAFPTMTFMYTALSNPGLYNESENDEPKVKYCQFCKVFQPKKVFHCPRCNVCIQDYDHHCPWISKCVGRKNIKSFYIFIISIPTLFIYFGFLIYLSITSNKQQ